MYQNNKIALLAVDEAHCALEWGHDFRPEYLNISQFREKIPYVPLMVRFSLLEN